MKRVLIVVCVVLGRVAAAGAQEERGVVVGATVAAASLESTTTFSFGGSAGYQFTRMVAFEIEAISIPTLTSSIDRGSVYFGSASSAGSTVTVLSRPFFQANEGRAVLFTTNMRFQLPTTAARLTPFFVVGGGAANVRHSADISLPVPLFPGGTPFPIPNRPTVQHVVSSMTDITLMLGGGLDVRIASRANVGADLRFYRLIGEQDLNVGRFGVGVRYRF